MGKTVFEMRERMDEIKSRLAAIDEESRDAALGEERQTEWDGLETEHAELRALLVKAEERAEKLKALAIDKPSVREAGSDRGAPAFHKKQTDDELYNLGELRSLSYSGEDFLRRVGDNAMRAIETSEFGVRNKEDAQGHAAKLLEECDTEGLDLAKRYLTTGSKAYERGFAKYMRNGTDAACTPEEREALVRAQTLGTDNQGGYAVPFQLDPTVILTNAGVTNPIRDLARIETIVGKEFDLVTSAGATVTRGGENAVAPDSSFTLGQPTVRTNPVQGLVPFSITADLSWGALRRTITDVLMDAKATEEDSFLTGNGSGTNPQGIVAGLSGTVTAAGTATFTAQDVYNLHTALDPRWERNAAFLGHKGIYNLVRQFDQAGGAQLWSTIGQGRPGELMGYAAYNASAMASTLTTANKILILGDFSKFLIVDRIGMNVEVIPHIFDTSTGFPKQQRGVYAYWMNNSKIVVPGAFEVLVTG
ncbi:phage major capsid protein [Streptomyces sp. NPDC055085]